jgi:acetylornithine deacetylase/succinyl-diaminopimelate desuccinylase-like protein
MEKSESKVLSYIDRDEIIEFMQELIRAKSDYPPGDTRQVAEICVKKLKEYDVKTETLIAPPEVKSINKD